MVKFCEGFSLKWKIDVNYSEKNTMPELPEIAYAKKYADATALHRPIRKVGFGASRPLQQSETSIRTALKNHSFTKTRQIGKYLFLKSGGGKWLVLHFGMSGRLNFAGGGEPPKHSIITTWFSDDSHFSFVCPRKFGKVWLAEDPKSFQKEHDLGPDVLSVSKKKFLELLEEKKTSGIKSFLMDQHNISGLGNVYSDEVLFQSKVHPKTRISELEPSQRANIFKNISKVIPAAVEFIGEGSKAPSSWLKAHRKEGASCPSCDGKVKKIQVGGRSTYFCPNCQKE